MAPTLLQHTVIERLERVAEGVAHLTLRGRDGALAPWEPGAHVDLVLPNWLTRQYSLCGDPGDRARYRVAVRHDPLSRGGSEYVNLFLTEGHPLDVSLPRNNFRFEPAPSYLFIAGGIGITPLVPMLKAVLDAGAPAGLLFVGRSRPSMPFAGELQQYYGDRVTVVDTAHQSRPDLAALAADTDPATLVYCCGPPSMLADVEKCFPAAQLRIERFQPVSKTHAPNSTFIVTCARSGQTVEVAADTSLLDALTYAGTPVPAGCREGVCGSCEVTVLEGLPEHRDDIGAPPGRMYSCVSRAMGPTLVLDL